MSLYDDDIDTDKTAASGWASGIKLMHNQLAFKKATITAPKRDVIRKTTSTKLPPVIDLKSRREDDENIPPGMPPQQFFAGGRQEMEIGMKPPTSSPYVSSSDPEWKFFNEYDPIWPNDYEKVVKEMRDRRDREEEDKRRTEREERDKKRRERLEEMPSGFSKKHEPEEEDDDDRPRRAGQGAAIAPPASLDDSSELTLPMPVGKSSASFGGIGGSIAAKIMAKYGFKEGQGLGKSQQGIVRALEVEKTSKRGGRIVSDLEDERLSPPPPSMQSPFMLPPPASFSPKLAPAAPTPQEKSDQNIAAILRNPSKVSLLRNMVGPGDVDDDLEPEVREECGSKYGPVVQVVIFEIPRAPPDEAVRIFVEFQRVEAAIKAVIDLNGRFFGGRQVKAGFYDYANFKAYKLNESV